MQTYDATALLSPDSEQLRFLPEGPYPCPGGFSWVAIQHGADDPTGSLNVYNFAKSSNRTYPLPGRPGFAYATNSEGVFVVGLERSLVLFDTATSQTRELAGGLEANVTGTIINDGCAFADGLVFGCKDLTFQTPKAGLYLWRRQDGAAIQLRADQTCSNGKVLSPTSNEGEWDLLDIDTPTKTVVRSTIHVPEGRQSEPQVVLDLTSEDFFPDGMIATPDNRSVIIAMYNPNDPPHGEARQYNLESGALEAVWRTPKSPQVTCPQLIEVDGVVKLILTTAVEDMSAERRALHPQAGTTFIADTNFDSTPETPVFVCE